ncbi:MAG: hypothetical protein AAF458_18465 [Pseudomonadota bacterium]
MKNRGNDANRFFMRDQLREPVNAMVDEPGRNSSLPLDLGGAGLAVLIALVTLINLVATAPGA